MKVIVYKRADGGVSICNPAPQWIEKLINDGMTEDEAYAAVQDKDVPSDATNIELMEKDTILQSREFRNAWTKAKTGAPKVNMPKARVIHIDRIRIQRDKKLKELDVDYIRADEINDQTEKIRIATLKQTLRDIPSTFDLSTFTTANTLSAAWPNEVPR